MEILSDAVFHGNVEAKEQIKVGSSIIRTFNHNFNGSERSEWILSDDPIRVGQVGASNIFSRGSLTIGSNSIQIGRFAGNHSAKEPIDESQFSEIRTITFPSKSATLATRNDWAKRIILPNPPIPSNTSSFYFMDPANHASVYVHIMESVSEFLVKQVIDTSTNLTVQMDVEQTKQTGGDFGISTGYSGYWSKFIGYLPTPHEEIPSGKYRLVLI